MLGGYEMTDMMPRMSNGELHLFASFLQQATSYVEFGAGGSTVLASRLVQGSIVGIESDANWITSVKEACRAHPTQPEVRHVDIGATKEWGFPADETARNRWPSYSTSIWEMEGSEGADLYLVDGRFRVACFAQAVLHARPDSIIGIHDFTSRPHYHSVRHIGREIACYEDISFFLPHPEMMGVARILHEEFQYVPD
jgi:hypothetical protein